MRKFFLSFILLFQVMVVLAYVSQETLFDQFFIFNSNNIVKSDVLSIRGSDQFERYVLESEKPVVLYIFSRTESKFVRLIYSSVVDSFRDRVLFTSLDISYQDNFNIIRSIMGKASSVWRIGHGA